MISQERFVHYISHLGFIDQEHKQIVDLATRIDNDCKRNDNLNLYLDLNLLRELIKLHFSTEEGLMEDTNYPYIEAHRMSHRVMGQEFEKRVSVIIGSNVSFGSMSSFEDMFLSHIESYDFQMVEYALSKGYR
jgi:hemerythrin